MARTTKKGAAAEPAAPEANTLAAPAPAKRRGVKQKGEPPAPAAPKSAAPKRRRASSKDAAVEAGVATRPASAIAVDAPPFPSTNYAVVERILTDFIRREVTRVGVDSVVVGLSGGVDSAVSAALAARALGKKKALGVMMPYRTSSEASLADAQAVAKSLGIETLTVDITTPIDAYFAHFPDASERRRGNKMARERMTVLYDLSAARSALVLGTSNKTELLLGYGTLYGDMASALNPIGDLYKTQVWGLAEHLDLPKSVIGKAPTADLAPGQTDEQDLGFGYHDVDRLLYRMIDERARREDLLAAGFDAAFVDRVHAMVQKSQFKRRLPIIAKVSLRTIDADFRYSRDWGR